MNGEKNIDALVVDAETSLKAGDIDRVIAIYKKLAAYGVPRVSARIGELYETGYKHNSYILEKNTELAVEWYSRAIIESNDPLAHLEWGGFIMKEI